MQGGCIGGYPSGVGKAFLLGRVFFYDPPEKSVENYLVNNKWFYLTLVVLGLILGA